jgi:hypothetical protein
MIVVGRAEIEIHDSIDLAECIGMLVTVSQFCSKVKQVGGNRVSDFLLGYVIDCKVKSALIDIYVSTICSKLIISFCVIVAVIFLGTSNIAQLKQLLSLKFEASVAVISDIVIIVCSLITGGGTNIEDDITLLKSLGINKLSVYNQIIHGGIDVDFIHFIRVRHHNIIEWFIIFQ